MNAKKELGEFGERVAAHRLEADGLTLVARQVRLPSGEIDLVMRDRGELVCVEVRTRRASAPGGAAESLTPVKVERMWRCAMDYAELNGIDPETLRLDAVALEVDLAGHVVHIEHFRGVGAD